MPERSIDWMKQAEKDIEAAEVMKNNGRFEWACFISHQAAEKAVKAVYQKNNATAWGHSIYELLNGLSNKINLDESLLDCARALDRFYIPTRYPNGFESGSPFEYFTEKDAENGIIYSRRIVEFCKNILA